MIIIIFVHVCLSITLLRGRWGYTYHAHCWSRYVLPWRHGEILWLKELEFARSLGHFQPPPCLSFNLLASLFLFFFFLKGWWWEHQVFVIDCVQKFIHLQHYGVYHSSIQISGTFFYPPYFFSPFLIYCPNRNQTKKKKSRKVTHQKKTVRPTGDIRALTVTLVHKSWELKKIRQSCVKPPWWSLFWFVVRACISRVSREVPEASSNCSAFCDHYRGGRTGCVSRPNARTTFFLLLWSLNLNSSLHMWLDHFTLLYVAFRTGFRNVYCCRALHLSLIRGEGQER